MSDVELRIGMRSYDHLMPLFSGQVPTPGLKLVITKTDDLTIPRDDLDLPEPGLFDAGEVGFNRYVLAAAKQLPDHIIGLPAFVLRNFRHRCWYVRRDSPLQSLSELKGRRVGTDSWNDSGTMWARVAMRASGVDTFEVHWVLGRLSASAAVRTGSPDVDSEPAGGATYLKDGEYLLDALDKGEIEALTTASTPPQIYEKNGKYRRLVQNYPEVEAEYHRGCGYRPAQHIVAVRRDYAERHPAAVMLLYKALQDSWAIWWAQLKRFGDATPWAAFEVERMVRDFPGELPPYGLESDAHRKMLADMCREHFEQKLVERMADSTRLFASFESIQRSCKAAA